jgi:T5SS/PEP-CTERM-associated repeat protein
MSRRKRLITGCMALTALAAQANLSLAQSNAQATGNWSTPATWLGGEPTSSGAANIDGGFTVTVDQSGETAALLDVGTASGATGTLNVTGGDLVVTDGNGATEPNIPSIRIGQAAGSTGTFTMSGGTVFVDGAFDTPPGVGELIVGDNGNATMTQTGGELLAGDEMFIAFQPTSTATLNVSGGTLATQGRSILVGFFGNGTLNVSGTANVTAAFDVLMGFHPGSTGTLNQSGGTITANYLFTNSFTATPGSTVNLNMTGGTFNVNNAVVLGQGVGTTTMTHSAGAINAPTNNGDFVVADGGGNTSTYTISGTATVNLAHNFLVGVFENANGKSNGTVNQNGGTITAGDNLVVGRDGNGTWNLTAGTTTATNAFLGDFDSSQGTMRVSGGVLNLNGNLNVGGPLASNAPPDASRLEPSEANGAQGQALDANGTFIVQGTGGDINVLGNLLANPDDKSAFRNGPGQENDSILQFDLGATGVSTIDVGQIADLDGAVFDINDTAGFFTANPSASLTLISAAGGFGNVHTVTAAEQAGTGEGFSLVPGDVSAFNLAIQPRAGGGENLVLTKGAGGGDADFDNDGDVDGNDFLLIQRGLGTTTTAADIALWKTSFGSAVGAAGSVPEPNAIALSVCGIGALLLRRRRK